MPENQTRYGVPPNEDWRVRSMLPDRRGSSGMATGLLVAGLVGVGLAALGWYYLGPDLRRYMKIRNM